MRDEATGFTREQELFRGSLSPIDERVMGRKLIEGVIDFDRVKVLGVDAEKFGTWCVLRIERTYPMVVMPAGSSNVDTTWFHFQLAHGRFDRTRFAHFPFTCIRVIESPLIPVRPWQKPQGLDPIVPVYAPLTFGPALWLAL